MALYNLRVHARNDDDDGLYGNVLWDVLTCADCVKRRALRVTH